MEWIIVRNNCYPLPLMSMIVLTTGCVLLVAGSWTCRHPEVECATFCQSSTPPPAPRSRRPPARLSGPSRPQPCGFSSDLTLSYNVTQTKLYRYLNIYLPDTAPWFFFVFRLRTFSGVIFYSIPLCYFTSVIGQIVLWKLPQMLLNVNRLQIFCFF